MLTDTYLRNISGKLWNGAPEVADAHGLSIRVSPKGRVTFQYRYRFAGRARRMSLGVYPSVSLKAARAALAEAKEVLSTGVDPADRARLEKRKIEARYSVNRLLDEWLDVVAAKLIKREYWKRQFELHVRPYLGRFVFDDLEFEDWERVFIRLVRAGSRYQAGHLLRRLQYVAEWGRRSKRVSWSPVTDITIEDVGAVRHSDGDRVLSWQELGIVWSRIEGSRLASESKAFVKLAIVMLPRCVELVNSRWSHWDFDNEVWMVPKEYVKGRSRAVRRPIPKFACEWLDELRAERPSYQCLFPPVRKNEDRPMSASVPLGWPSSLASDIPSWSMHDFRRTGNTRMAELGVEPFAIEKLLGHRLQGVMAIYNRHDYLAEQLLAVEVYYGEIKKWASKVSG